MPNLNRTTLIRSKKYYDLSKLVNEESLSTEHRTQGCNDTKGLLMKLKENNELMTREAVNLLSRSTTRISTRKRKIQEDSIESSSTKTLYNPSPEKIKTQSMMNPKITSIN